MTLFYDLNALRPVSLFRPDVRRQLITVRAEPRQLNWLSEGKRRAEVLFVLKRRRNGGDEILLINRKPYPPDAYRLPTGGLEDGESPVEAAIREIYEETGYRIADPGLLGLVDYTLHGPGFENTRFVSYIFMGHVPAAQEPVAADPDEIAAYRWVSPESLNQVAAHLRTLPPDWVYWGRFRAASYEFIHCAIMQYNRGVGVELEAGR